MSASESRLPLDGVRVVALEQAVSAPFATRQLADLGARVVKVERVGEGDFARYYDAEVRGMASHFVWVNRNKESLALDFKTAEGRAILDELIAGADVVVQNLAPGTAESMGLDAAQLVARHPRLIACDVSGFGSGGPYDRRRAYDLVVQAEAGSIATTGWPDRPAKPGIAIADLAAGLYAFSSVLAALYEREHTGRGRALSVSMLDAIAELMGYSINFTQFSGRRHEPNGISHPSLSPYESFDTADGRKLVLAVQNDREWARLATEVLRRPDLVGDRRFATGPARTEHRAEVTAVCAPVFGAWSLEEAIAALDSADIACGRVNYPEDVLDHPQLAARQRWTEVDSPVGALRTLLPPPVSDGWAPRMDAVPAVGEHTRAILAELGRARTDVDRLVAAGIVSEPQKEC
ncbi:CaiB/BaiF CoA transferase family protein [Cryptosporangium sp. NPDC051539]|uniref:CaiB/BaiF CoA transferase family protein n=1 Tax=Cryptosporangium sp. NPDC051539 TaxID=3363962 RepID=UPI00379591A3